MKPGVRSTRATSPLRFGPAAPADDASLRRLLRENPMGGRISVSLECEPSFFNAISIEGERHQTVVARDEMNARIVAMGTRSVRRAFVNGLPTTIGYLGHLRVDHAYRHRARLLREGYAAAAPCPYDSAERAELDVTCIMADNWPAVRLLTAGVRGLPRYLEQDRLFTLAAPTSRAVRAPPRRSVQIEAGSTDRLSEIVECLDRSNRRFQFAPCWTAEDLASSDRCRGLALSDFHVALTNDRVVGCVACWNQRAFKQVVVRDYAWPLRRMRPLINCMAAALGQPRLPSIGEAVNGVFLSHMAVDGDDPSVALHLLEAARRSARARGHDLLIVGLSARHPLCGVVRTSMAHRWSEGILYVVDWRGCGESARGLDGRAAHMEVATL